MSSDATSYRERQEDELEVLKSVYSETCVEDLRLKAAWKNAWQPLKVKLILYPQESQGPHVQVFAQLEMIISCSSNYPDVTPTVELQNAKNVPDRKVKQLRAELGTLAQQNVGMEVVMVLAERVREFLCVYNQPPPQSLHQQMMDKQRRLQAEKESMRRQQQEDDERRRQEEMRQIEDMRRRRQQELREHKNETRTRRSSTRQSEEDGLFGSPKSPPTGSSRALSCSPRDGSRQSPTDVAVVTMATGRKRSTNREFSDSENDEHEGRARGAGVTTLTFKRGQEKKEEEQKIQRGKPQGSNGGGGRSVYCGMNQATGETVAIVEWVFKWRIVAKKSHVRTADLDDDQEAKGYLRQVQGIEKEAQSLFHLSHENIIRYLGFRYDREPGKITVHVLTEFCGGSNLGLYLKSRQCVPLETLRGQAEGLLTALHYLHSRAVVHKLLRASCVFVDQEGKVRLADYAIDKKLRDLYKSIDLNKGYTSSVDKIPPSLGRGSQKADIYQLGVTILGLATGNYITDITPEIPHTLPQNLKDFLAKCLRNNEQQRWSTTQLLEHPFLKEPISQSLQDQTEGDGRLEGDSEDSDRREFRPSPDVSSKSRLFQEFYVESVLGKGGYGDVLKGDFFCIGFNVPFNTYGNIEMYLPEEQVKNKLDGQLYAIKRIKFSQLSKLSSEKKITREVNLLSRLHHENIVRYYNAWVEYTDELDCGEMSTSADSSSRPSPQSSVARPTRLSPPVKRPPNLELDAFGDIERLAPQLKASSADWSFGQSHNAPARESEDSDDSSSDDDDDDEEDDDDNVRWGVGASIMPIQEDSNSIDFQNEDSDGQDDNPQATESDTQAMLQTDTPKSSQAKSSSILWASQSDAEDRPMMRCLYIQMQYCEKSTLRTAIDGGLWENMERVWHYFRGITEGLLYIHEQNMIHRDLKPVNIFLDANDHVKIGDFGLATTDIVKAKTTPSETSATTSANFDPHSFSKSGSGDGDLTGQVGTALYLSPEMMRGGAKLRYDQKVDIYSLGIIFFEMVYRPLATGMERSLVLHNMRKPDVVFPPDFDHTRLANQASLLRQMLNHDPAQRPSSRDLLASPCLPAVRAAEAEFNCRLDDAISCPDSQTYRRILARLFAQPYCPAMDQTYNMDTAKPKTTGSVVRAMLLRDMTTERLERVFRNNGAVRLDTPLLMPRPPQYAAFHPALPCFLDKSGLVVSLPFDLRLPFARYVAQSGMLSLKRFSIEHVYRQLKVQSLHPRQVTECAFDIITPARNTRFPEAEVMLVVQQVIAQFPVLQSHGYMVRMNHTKIIEALLLKAGVAEDDLPSIIQTVVENQATTEDQLVMTLRQKGVAMTAGGEGELRRCLGVEGDVRSVRGRLQSLARGRGRVSDLVRQGVAELTDITTYARELGLTMQVSVTLGLMSNLRQHSGLMFQVYHRKQHRKQKGWEVMEVLAAGGRYDKLVSEFSSKDCQLTAVGVSIAFDIALNALSHEKELQVLNPCEVMVCALGHKSPDLKKLEVMKILQASGIHAQVQYEPLQDVEDLQERCRAAGIPYLVIVKDNKEREGDTVFVRVKLLEARGAGTEKRVELSGLVDFIQAKMSSSRTERESPESNTTGGSTTPAGGGGGGGGSRYGDRLGVSRSHSAPTFSFTYTKHLGGKNKRLEELVCKKAPKWLSGEVEVVMSDLSEQVIRVIQGFIELNKEESDFDRSLNEIQAMLAKCRCRIPDLHFMDDIKHIRFEKKKQHILLYGSRDNMMRLLT